MGRADAYVDYLFQRLADDKALRADFRRADNETFEYKIWPVLNSFVDLERSGERKAYAIIGAAIAKSKMTSNGEMGLGSAFRSASQDTNSTHGNKEEKFPPRFSRLLSAESLDEVNSVIRPMLTLLISKGARLDFKRLLKDLVDFQYSPDRVRVRWAMDYMRSGGEDD